MNYVEEQNLNFQNPVPVSMASAASRASFYKKTYVHVALAFLGFIMVEAALFMTSGAELVLSVIGSRFGMIILMVGFMFGATAVERWAMKATDKGTQYLALAVYILLEAVIFVPLIAYATTVGGGMALENILLPGVIITVALFSGLVLTVFITGKDFTFLKAAIGIGSMIALGLMVVSWIFGMDLGSWFSIGMIVLMAGAILYQTSQVQHMYHEKQHVAAAVSIFASFMTLLFYVIRLLSSRD